MSLSEVSGLIYDIFVWHIQNVNARIYRYEPDLCRGDILIETIFIQSSALTHLKTETKFEFQ